MTRFVHAADGAYVNLDHVATVVPDGHHYLLKAADGTVLGKISNLRDIPVWEMVPAAAGQVATVITVYDFDSQPPDVEIKRLPVVAWRIERDGMNDDHSYTAHPIIAGWGVADNQAVLVERPDGQLDDCDDGTYASLDAAKAAIVRRERKKRPTHLRVVK